MPFPGTLGGKGATKWEERVSKKLDRNPSLCQSRRDLQVFNSNFQKFNKHNLFLLSRNARF